MKKRSPAAVLLLPFATLGIYCIYWAYATRKELVTRNGQPNSIPPVLVVFAPILLLVALVIAIFAINWNGDGGAAIAILDILLGMIGVVAVLAVPLWWFWRYCHVLAETTRSTDVTQLYVLYVVLTLVCNIFPVWMLIAQLELNKIADYDAEQHHNAHPHAHAEHHVAA